MNKQRRKDIEVLSSKLEDLKSEIENLQEEETGYLDNMPESFQGGEKGDKAQEAIDNLENAASSLQDVIDYLTSAVE